MPPIIQTISAYRATRKAEQHCCCGYVRKGRRNERGCWALQCKPARAPACFFATLTRLAHAPALRMAPNTPLWYKYGISSQLEAELSKHNHYALMQLCRFW